MIKVDTMKTILTAILVLMLAGPVYSATKGRIMTNGKVSFHKNGKVVNSFSEQGPIDENSLVACDGTCLVKMTGVSLVAVDKTMFAVRESGDAVNLYVEKGKVDFAVADIGKEFAFYTSNGYLVRTEGFIAPVSTENNVKGFMRVTDQGTEIGMEKGTMIVQTDEGTKSVGPGQAILLAMADVPDNNDNADDKAVAATCPFFSWECKTSAQKLGIIGGGAAAALGVGLLVYWDASLDDDQIVNIFMPNDTPGSPNM